MKLPAPMNLSNKTHYQVYRNNASAIDTATIILLNIMRTNLFGNKKKRKKKKKRELECKPNKSRQLKKKQQDLEKRL